MPEVELPSRIISLKHNNLSAEEVARKLRTENKPAVIGRIQKDEFLIDLRTVTEEEEAYVLHSLIQL